MIIKRNIFLIFFLKFYSMFNCFVFIYTDAEIHFVVEYTLGVGRFKGARSMIW